MQESRHNLTTLLSLLLFLSIELSLFAQDLQSDLRRLDGLRRGKSTPFDKVEQLGAELLKKYAAPRDQGLINYQLCHVYAQSGQARPEQTIAHAKKALQYPLEPLQKLMLYTYWGDAEQVADRKKPHQERRKPAAAAYLQGLQEARKLNLPDSLPPRPASPKVDVEPTDPRFLKLMLQHEKEMEAYRKTEHLRPLIQQRDILTDQIAQMYSRKPFATQELEQMAKATLDDPQEVNRLMGAVRTAVAKASGGQPEPVADAGGLSGLQTILVVVAGVGMIILALFLVPAVLRKFRHRTTPG
jgi:hypothetical protein